jgi:G:T-mismatch repair DNA endonuclease (very short patch repair protein)
MESPGEHLVGQYLREILNCDFVEFNLQTKFVQGEIDVVGINSTTNQVYICEVATHLETGLQYTKARRPDNVDRFVKKFKKNIEFSERNFQEYEVSYMLWTPIIRIPKSNNTKHKKLKYIEYIRSKIRE